MIKKQYNKFESKNNKGIVLYLAILILASSTAIAASVATLFIGQYKMLGDITNSMRAVYAADSGLEIALYEVRKNSNSSITDCSLLPGMTCSILIDTGNTTCLYGNCTLVESTGQNFGFYRKIQAVYNNQ